MVSAPEARGFEPGSSAPHRTIFYSMTCVSFASAVRLHRMKVLSNLLEHLSPLCWESRARHGLDTFVQAAAVPPEESAERRTAVARIQAAARGMRPRLVLSIARNSSFRCSLAEAEAAAACACAVKVS